MDSFKIDSYPVPQRSARSDFPASLKPAGNAAEAPPVPVKESKVTKPYDAPADLERARAAAVARAAETVANYFAVSDMRFTIFKDNNGQYITRFTSLKDGSVSYYPEPQLVKMYGKISGEDLSLFSAKV